MKQYKMEIFTLELPDMEMDLHGNNRAFEQLLNDYSIQGWKVKSILTVRGQTEKLNAAIAVVFESPKKG